MKIEDMVCSLELAKKLKEIGAQQHSLYYWTDTDTYFPQLILAGDIPKNSDSPVSAFISDELLKLLPNSLTLDNDDPLSYYSLEICKRLLSLKEDKGKFFYNYTINYVKTAFDVNLNSSNVELIVRDLSFKEKLLEKNIFDKKLSNAIAMAIIYLVENKLWTIEK